MFKVGDKVSHPIWGNGVITEVDDFYTYPVAVSFKNRSLDRFSREGRWKDTDIAPSLYHGHGTFEINFTPEPEPVYEWQWEYFGVPSCGGERLYITKHYKSEKDMMAEEAHPARRDFIRIERSKRLVKG